MPFEPSLDLAPYITFYALKYVYIHIYAKYSKINILRKVEILHFFTDFGADARKRSNMVSAGEKVFDEE